MILAEAATSALPSADGWIQIGMIAAAGVATYILAGFGAKPQAGSEKAPTSTGSWLPKLSFGGDGDETPTFAEAYDMLTRLSKLSPELVPEYGEGITNATKHLTWLKSEGQSVAAP